MGTNFYLHKPSKSKCNHCGHDPELKILHIGKSSFGWRFALHVIPEEGINSLEDWKREWSAEGSFIKNEYEETISVEKMLDTITNRKSGRFSPEGMEPQFHELDRQYCLGHGEGSWDYMVGEFS